MPGSQSDLLIEAREVIIHQPGNVYYLHIYSTTNCTVNFGPGQYQI
jgi:hypothetical protein